MTMSAIWYRQKWKLAEEMFNAAVKDFNDARAEIAKLEEYRATLLERPDIAPCQCGHSWRLHGYSENELGYRGGCNECNCNNVVTVVGIGQGYGAIIVMP